MISIIVAIDDNNAIGKNGDLLCHLPNDLKHFKEVTSGHTVIMGKRTWFSLPKHPLPNRKNIVISDVPGEQLEGAIMAYSIQEAVDLVLPEEEAFVVGGGMIYKQFEPIADKLYITHIHHAFEGADTFFPMIDRGKWVADGVGFPVNQKDEKNPYDHTFINYIRP